MLVAAEEEAVVDRRLPLVEQALENYDFLVPVVEAEISV